MPYIGVSSLQRQISQRVNVVMLLRYVFLYHTLELEPEFLSPTYVTYRVKSFPLSFLKLQLVVPVAPVVMSIYYLNSNEPLKYLNLWGRFLSFESVPA